MENSQNKLNNKRINKKIFYSGKANDLTAIIVLYQFEISYLFRYKIRIMLLPYYYSSRKIYPNPVAKLVVSREF